LSFRTWIQRLRRSHELVEASRILSTKLEAAAFVKAMEPRPVSFNVRESEIPVAANICASRETIANYLKIPTSQITTRLLHAIDNPSPPQIIDRAPCMALVEKEVDLDSLPLLLHTEKDGGRYISSAVVIARHPEIGQNVSFHRMMQISKNELAIRIVPRHLNMILEKTSGDLPIAVCIGTSPNVLLSGACSVELGRDELHIANTLEPLLVTKCKEANCFVPAETEIVLVGRITSRMHAEGPFIDLTETYDLIRSQHVVTIDMIYNRTKPIYHALLPGGLEHKMLMGIPREPTIYREVAKVCTCLDVAITPGGGSWLHAVVKILKKDESDGKRAIEAAFRGHTSLKHVAIVDEDIDIHNLMEVEWAFATRFQGDRGLVVKTEQTGSSLDPSADPITRATTKVGFDATKPLETKGKEFQKAALPTLDWRKYVK